MNKVCQHLLIIIIIILTIGCKKEPDCGCDGPTIFQVESGVGVLYFGTGFAYIVENQFYARYNICSVKEFKDIMDEMESGEEVVFSGNAKDDCFARYNPYVHAYYNIVLTELAKAGK